MADNFSCRSRLAFMQSRQKSYEVGDIASTTFQSTLFISALCDVM